MHPIALGNRNGSFLSPSSSFSFFLSPPPQMCCACFTVVDERLVGKLSRDILLVNVPLLVHRPIFPSQQLCLD